jgi:hypothetical protein
MNITAAKLSAVALIAAASLMPLSAQAQPCQCQLPDNGSGTVTMPPACIDGYLGTLQIVNGLVNATIQIDAKLFDFQNLVESPGGTQGGTFSTFSPAALQMQMTGTGALNGFSRTISIPIINGRLDWGPRTGNAPVQTFPGDFRLIQGTVFGDPDFDELTFTSGSQLGFPNFGSSTLARIGGIGSDFLVDSFFDIEYEITYQGAAGSVLDGMAATHADFTRLSICGAPPVAAERIPWGAIKALYSR